MGSLYFINGKNNRLVKIAFFSPLQDRLGCQRLHTPWCVQIPSASLRVLLHSHFFDLGAFIPKLKSSSCTPTGKEIIFLLFSPFKIPIFWITHSALLFHPSCHQVFFLSTLSCSSFGYKDSNFFICSVMVSLVSLFVSFWFC